MTVSVAGVVSKTEGIFDRIILPGLSLAAGWFGGPILFSALEARVALIDANGDGVSDLDTAFGPGYNGSGIVTGLGLAAIGFSVYRMGSFIKFLGLFMIGAGLSMIASGFKLV